MKLITTTFFSGVASVLKIACGFVVTKVIAVYVGPAGMGIIGQLQNFINIILLVTGDFLKTAVTKYTADYKDKEEEQYEIWSASVRIISLFSFVFFVPLFFYSQDISLFLLKNADYSYVLKIFSFSLPFFVFNTLLLSILNGYREIKKYILLQVFLSIVSLVVVALLSVSFGLSGALIGYVINQSVVCLFTVAYLRKEPWLKISNFFVKKIRNQEFKKIFKFATMTLVSVSASNLSTLYVRSFLIDTTTLVSAGYWQAIWVLSQAALTVITISLTTYYLPKLSSLKTKKMISEEIKKILILILPISIIVSSGVFWLRDVIIVIMYDASFLPMRTLFFWQFFGNIIKTIGWLFGYVLVAKSMVKYTVITEVVLGITFVFFTVVFVNRYSIVGATYAYAINSIIHLIMVMCIYKYIFKDFHAK